MKKLLCLLLALAMALSLIACGSQDSKPSDTDEDEDEELVDIKDEDEDEDKDEGEDTTEDTTEDATEDTTEDATEDTTEDATEDTTEETTEATQPQDSGVDYSDAILGSWTVELVVTTEDMGLNEDETLKDFHSQIALQMIMTFHEDGTAVMEADQESLTASVEAFQDDLVAFMVELMYAELEASGYDRETGDQLFMDAYQMTVTEFCQQTVAEMGLVDALNASDLNDSGVYTLNGNQLTVSGDVMTIEIQGDELHILDCNNPGYWEDLGFAFPVTLKRVG